MRTVAILCSDVHLSHNPPRIRAIEESWYGAMERTLKQIGILSAKHRYPPIIYAGDIFDKWNSPPELINFALRCLPKGYAVAGQHDLPHHSYKDIHKSAFWTLVKADKLHLLRSGHRVVISTRNQFVNLYGFSYDSVIKPLEEKPTGLNIAVVHAYIWMEGQNYDYTPEDRTVSCYSKSLQGYDVAVFGDNHINFYARTASGCNIWNNGGLMRRTLSDLSRKPCVGLLQEDGTIIRHELDTSEDKVILQDLGTVATPETDKVSALILELNKTSEQNEEGFEKLIRQLLEDKSVRKSIKKIIIKALEK